jgi:MraZ protein
MFRGLNKISLDTKGRVSIPTKYRDELLEISNKKLICTIDLDHCLLLYPLANWLKIEKQIMKLPSLDATSRKLQRLLVGHATDIEMDGSARILIPKELREFSRINKEAMLIGQGNRFELWDYSMWTQLRDKWLKSEKFSLPKEFESLTL